MSCVGSVECRGGGGGRRGRRTNLGMEDMAQIGGLVAGHGREAEVVNPTLSEKANSIKYVRYPVGLESLCQVKTFSGVAIKLQ